MAGGPSEEAYYQTPGHSVAAAVTLPVVAILMVGLRFFIRLKHGHPMKTDDWLLVPATALASGMGITILYAVSKNVLATEAHEPTQEEIDNVPEWTNFVLTDQIASASKIEFANSLMLPLALGCLKLSFLFFYYRIFVVQRKSVTGIFLITCMVLIGCWAFIFFMLTIFQCNEHPQALWGYEEGASCPEALDQTLIFCATDTIGDLILLIIPVPLIWNLKLSTAKKMGTVCVFLLGGATIVASVLRLVYSAASMKEEEYSRSDVIRALTVYLYWGIVETGVGILAACLPSFAGLLRSERCKKLFGRTRGLFSSTEGSHDDSHDRSRSRPAKSIELDSSSGSSIFSRQSHPKGSPNGTEKMPNLTPGMIAESEFQNPGRLSGPTLSDIESARSAAFSETSRGSNRRNMDSAYFNSLATDTTWRTRYASVEEDAEGGLAPPPIAHGMKDLQSNPI